MTQSLWSKINIGGSTSLQSNLEAEICIIGAGISGLTTAYQLVKYGRRVVVVHAGDLRSGETVKSTAQINTVHDDSWAAMKAMHGVESVKLCYQSYLHAYSFIKRIIADERIECGYETLPAYLFGEHGAADTSWIEDEYEAARSAGVTDVAKQDRVDLTNFESGPALVYGEQAQFHPLSYLSEIRRILIESGKCEIYGHAQVTDVEEGDPYSTITLETGITIRARRVVMATNVPFHRKLVPIDALAAYRSYVVAFRVPLNAIPRAQYWDNGDPYHYARLEGEAADSNDPSADSEILLVGGEDHRVGEHSDLEKHYGALTTWAKERFPIISVTGLRWSAQTIETFDGMPLIGVSGATTKNIYIITGDSGTGITHGTVGGLLIAEKLLGGDFAWSSLYDPGRSRTKSLSRWTKENLTSLMGYRDWLTPGEVSDVNEIPVGEGAVMRQGASKLAIYRDADGGLTYLSATCPHLGATLRWNSVENSWDCPAHGSRFSPRGEVLNGPANCSLCKVEGPDSREGESIPCAPL